MANVHADRTVVWRGVEISGKDAADFINETGTEESCPHCKANAWGLAFSPGDGLFAAIPQAKESVIHPLQYQGVYSLYCGNCGYMQLHTLAVLANWVQSKKSENAERQEESEKGTEDG